MKPTVQNLTYCQRITQNMNFSSDFFFFKKKKKTARLYYQIQKSREDNGGKRNDRGTRWEEGNIGKASPQHERVRVIEVMRTRVRQKGSSQSLGLLRQLFSFYAYHYYYYVYPFLMEKQTTFIMQARNRDHHKYSPIPHFTFPFCFFYQLFSFLR